MNQEFKKEYKNKSSEEFVKFAKNFERGIKKALTASGTVGVSGVQLVALTNGSVVASFNVFFDTSATTSSNVEAVLKDPNNYASASSAAFLKINAARSASSIKTTGPNPCVLGPCGKDSECVPTGTGPDYYKCQCIKDANGECRSKVIRDWTIAVIVVAVFVFVLILFVVIVLVRMHLKKKSIGRTSYNFDVAGKDNRGAVPE